VIFSAKNISPPVQSTGPVTPVHQSSPVIVDCQIWLPDLVLGDKILLVLKENGTARARFGPTLPNVVQIQIWLPCFILGPNLAALLCPRTNLAALFCRRNCMHFVPLMKILKQWGYSA